MTLPAVRKVLYGVCWRCGATLFHGPAGWKVVFESTVPGCRHSPSREAVFSHLLDMLRELV